MHLPPLPSQFSRFPGSNLHSRLTTCNILYPNISPRSFLRQPSAIFHVPTFSPITAVSDSLLTKHTNPQQRPYHAISQFTITFIFEICATLAGRPQARPRIHALYHAPLSTCARTVGAFYYLTRRTFFVRMGRA